MGKNNSGITLVDVRETAMDIINDLRNDKIDIKKATTVKGLLDTVIDTAKAQTEFLKTISPNVKDEMTKDEVKAIAGTLVDRDAELDKTLSEVGSR